jgi:hypothetical protein
MAITVNGVRFLSHCRGRGLSLDHTTVVGRQGLFAPPGLLRPILARHGLSPGPEHDAFFNGGMQEWADPLLRALGATRLEFMDYSDYEGATRLHDLNQPVGASWEESTGALVDAGSLEHVFDVRTAIENYLRIVRVGGDVVLMDMPAVSFCGHGFYQFSPEFFCEVFSERNGFELVSLMLAEEWAFAPFYSVTRPRDAGGRVEIVDGRSCHLFVHARKKAPFHGFSGSIVQSDYETAWKRPAPAGAGDRKGGGLADALRSAWRRFDPKGYWTFTTRRDTLRKARAHQVGRSGHLTPIDL